MFVFLHGIHLLSVIIAVGGVLVLRFVVLPLIGSDEANSLIRQAIHNRWKLVVWIAIVLILLSGLANLHQAAMRVKMDMLYWIVFSVKFLLALVLFGIALLLTLPGESFEKFKQEREKWMHVIVALGIIIVFLSSYLRLCFPRLSP
jgi:uncharacterized membrane protein